MRILVTRPSPDGERTAEALTAMGHEALLASMLEIRFETDVPIDLTGATALAFTSRNGVRAAHAHAAFDALSKLKTYCVGEATAEEAKASGFQSVVCADGDVAALARSIVAAGETGPILHLRGRHAAGDLSGDLEREGIESCAAILYRSEPVPALPRTAETGLSTGQIDAILFYSPRTAKTFVNILKDDALISARTTPCLCLSDTIAKPLRAAGFERVKVSVTPDAASLMALVADESASQQHHTPTT